MQTATDNIDKIIYDKKQMATKVINNTIYGASGAKSSPHYNPIIARSITAAARIALNKLKQISIGLGYTNILAWDTDAVNFSAGPKLDW